MLYINKQAVILIFMLTFLSFFTGWGKYSTLLAEGGVHY